MNVFPALRGLGFPIRVTPLWTNQIQRTVSGRMVAATYQQYPLWKFRLGFNFLTQADSETLIGFFSQQSGSLTPFWFDAGLGLDAVAAQGLGVGDGTTTQFQLQRAYGGYVEPVAAAFGTLTAYVNGTAAAATFNSPSAGYVTFTTAPASGAVLTWTGNYYFQVRFSKASIDFDQFMSQLYDAKEVDLETYL